MLRRGYGTAKPILAYNRKRNASYVFDSITDCAKGLGVSTATVRSRLQDGYCIHCDNEAIRIKRI